MFQQFSHHRIIYYLNIHVGKIVLESKEIIDYYSKPADKPRGPKQSINKLITHNKPTFADSPKSVSFLNKEGDLYKNYERCSPSL